MLIVNCVSILFFILFVSCVFLSLFKCVRVDLVFFVALFYSASCFPFVDCYGTFVACLLTFLVILMVIRVGISFCYVEHVRRVALLIVVRSVFSYVHYMFIFMCSLCFQV